MPYLTSTEFDRFFDEIIKKREGVRWQNKKILENAGTDAAPDFTPIQGYEYANKDENSTNALVLPKNAQRRKLWLQWLTEWKKEAGLE